ncbi:MAG: 1,4-dihydroxy-2-naphthoate octaprenyltransferase [Bacteroides sp.]|nr:1,4-dihydroxy-2-naphthoate octaprenyltransferase [Bacteroides sp.]MCM1378930.1 1,4-dihydroxy-2-naphthoate octaprenyltransferase [Bacteroides sp.]MCM1445546.1 1,4-dihydroxy-2-naphthoate octaprenyltransferase [Prevotella sp.]
MTRTKAWIEGMRLRTLPVSLAAVIAAIACVSTSGHEVLWGWATVCLLFALLAQIASNFANEYFDFRDGIDTTEKRRGPERGVTIGLITPRQMLAATLITLAAACAVGLTTILRGGWWLLPCGVFIALGVLAYSAGPYPLSRHCLGEVAVVIFYGIIPVTLTYYVLTLTLSWTSLILGIAMGMWIAMVILVNNYRDIDADRAVGKHTVSTKIGPQGSAILYCALGQLAGLFLFLAFGLQQGFLPLIPMILGFCASKQLYFGGLSGKQCTAILALTSVVILLTSILFLIISFFTT